MANMITYLRPDVVKSRSIPADRIIYEAAVALSTEDAAANKTNIAAYEATLTAQQLIPVVLDGEYAGYIQRVNTASDWYAGVLKGGAQISVLAGVVTVKDLCYNEPSGLTTTAQTVAGAINELNAKTADGVTVHNAGETYTDTLPDGVTEDEPFNIQTLTVGTWNNNTYKAQILTGINTTDRTLKRYQRITADNGANWSAWAAL